jgi:transcriptional regulator with XRE-family HTH domain
MITSEQVRAARALLRWEQKDLAEASKISLPSIKRLEGQPGALAAQGRTADAIEAAFVRAGVKFIEDGEVSGGGSGVRLAKASNSDTDESETLQYPEFKDGDGGPGSGG